MLKSFFDDYVIKGRIMVGLLVGLPLIIVIPWCKEVFLAEANPWIINPAISASILALIAVIVRQMGLNAEKVLINEWGEYPSTLIMRWRDNKKSNEWKIRFHGLVKDKLKISLASPEEEATDPKEADARIGDAFSAIRTRIWGQKDLPSHTDNKNYGFARNLYGCRWLWLSISIVCLLFLILTPALKKIEYPAWEIIVCAAITIAIPVLEWRVIKPQVRHCAFSYAEHAWESLVDF